MTGAEARGAAASDRPAATGDGEAGIDAWKGLPRILVVISVVLPLTISTVTLFEGRVTPAGRLIGIGLAIAFGAWAVGFRNKVCEGDERQQLLWNAIYLAGCYVLFFGMALISLSFLFLLFLMFWRTFSSLRLAFAIPCSIVLVALAGGAQLASGSVDELDSVLISSAITLVFSIGTGVFIGRIIDQSLERASLIAELEAARDELGKVNHAAGVAAERARLAHEIHDTLAQGFTSIVMLLQGVDAVLGDGEADGVPDVARARAGIAAAEQTARDNLAEARNLVEGMLPAPLVDDSLAGALGRLAERTGTDLGIDVPCRVSGDERPLAPTQEVALLRIAQEAVSNARRHATPARIELALDYGDGPADPVVLTVTDDGVGFDPDTVEPGVGLSGMRQRLRGSGSAAEQLGDVRVESSPGAGTKVTAVLV